MKCYLNEFHNWSKNSTLTNIKHLKSNPMCIIFCKTKDSNNNDFPCM